MSSCLSTSQARTLRASVGNVVAHILERAYNAIGVSSGDENVTEVFHAAFRMLYKETLLCLYKSGAR